MEHISYVSSYAKRFAILQLSMRTTKGRLSFFLRYLNKNEGDESSDVSFRSSYQTSEPVGVSATAMDRQDIYVSVVTSLNTWFGSKVRTQKVFECMRNCYSCRLYCR